MINGERLHIVFYNLNTFYDMIQALLNAQPTLVGFALALAKFVKNREAGEAVSDTLHVSSDMLHTPVTVSRFLALRRRIIDFLHGHELSALSVDDGRAVVKLFHLLWGGEDLSVVPDDIDRERAYMKRILEFDLADSDIGFPTTIGASSFSVVYEGTFKVPDDDWEQALWRTRVAVKMFLPEAITVEREPYFRQCTLRINTFSHPCLLVVHMANWPQGISLETTPGEKMIKDVFAVSELMTHNLRAARHLPALASPRIRLKILADVAEGLAYLHRMGMAHMGVAPENVLVRVQGNELYGRAKLDVTTFFKHALFPHWKETFLNHLWLYRPPEKYREENLFFTADSWSFGALACFLMSDGAENDERFYAGQTCSKSHRKLMRSWCSTIGSERLKELIIPCLRENPEDRPVPSQIVEKLNELIESMSLYSNDSDDDEVAQQPHVNAAADKGRGSLARDLMPPGDSRRSKQNAESSSDSSDEGRVLPINNFERTGGRRKRRAKYISGSELKRRRIELSDSADPDWSFTSGQVEKNKDATISSSTATQGPEGQNGRAPGIKRRSETLELGSRSPLSDELGIDTETADAMSLGPNNRISRKSLPPRGDPQRRARSDTPPAVREPDSTAHSPRTSHRRSARAGDRNSVSLRTGSGVWSDEDDALLIEREMGGRPSEPQMKNGPQEQRLTPALTAADVENAEQSNAQGEVLLESGKPGCMEQAVDLFKRAAYAGNAKAQVNYGNSLELGRGVQRDFGEAAYYFQLAAEQGHPQGQLKIGLCHEFGRGTKKDYKAAVEWYKRASVQGHTQAQINLAIAYQQGRGINADHVKAAELYQIAADSGQVAAQLNLGVLYEEGKGVPKDPAKAFKLYEKASIGGSHAAMLNLALCYQRGQGCERSLEKAAIMFVKAAERDNTMAMLKAGQCYENGEGVKIDLTKAAFHYRRAAENNDVVAVYNLGRMYLRGAGVSKDPTKAFKLFGAASKNGHIPATVMLGWCHDNAVGTKESTEKAVSCYKVAERHGSPKAKVYLGYKYEMGRGVKMNKSVAVRLYRESAAAGCPKGETALGQCYQFGYGMPKCITTAVELYERAVEKGDDGACEELGKLCRDGTEIEQDEAKALMCFKLGAEVGNVTCMLNYGEFLYYGKATSKDLKGAVEQFGRAASLNCAEGYRWLGDCYSEGSGVEMDMRKAAECFQKGAQLGSSVAQTSLGCCYENGQGVVVDGQKAVELYRKAMNGGNLTAMNNLGILYEKGQSVKRDYVKAFKYYQKSRNGGNVDAICNLADCYANEHGVVKNLVKAYELYQEASDLGQAGAQCELGACYYYGRGVDADFGKAVELFQKASGSEPEAVRHLGTAYFDGNGVEQDYDKALQLFVKAAEAGNEDAYLNIGVCHEYGKGAERNLEKAAEFYRKAITGGNKTAARCLGNFYLSGYGVVKDVTEAVRLFTENPIGVDEILS